MLRRLLAAVLLVCALALPVVAQDTFVTVTDVVGGIYHLPLSDCPTQGMTYTRATNSFGCASGSAYPAPGSTTQVLFNDGGVIGADAGFTYVKGTDTATLGALVLATTPLAATSGGTGFASYAVGDLLYASTTTALSKLADVAAGSYLRSGGVATAPAWSTVTLPNSATTGDLLSVSASNVYANITAGGLGTVLASAGAGTLPVWSSSPNILTPSVNTLHINNIATATNTTDTHSVIYGTTTGGGAYPYLTAGNLILQSRPSGADRDIVFITGSTPALRMQVSSIGGVVVPPATQTIAAGNTITANACGTLKAITAAGAVSTDTTNVFTAPAAINTGCVMKVCNVGVTNAITLKHATLFFSLAGADVVLLANSCIDVLQDGTEWRQTTVIMTAS